MRKVSITDITLREAAAAHATSLSFKETIEIAKILDRFHVDVIELAPIENPKVDPLLIHTVTAAVRRSVLSMPAGMTKESVEAAWNAVSGAVKPRLCVELPVSAVQMEFMCRKKSDAMVEMIKELVSACGKLCGDVEFAALDATRGEKEFVVKALKTAAAAGASSVTLCDSAGAMLPEEMADFIKSIISMAELPDSVKLSVRCSDAYSMAAAVSMTAAVAGASGIEVTAGGVSAPSIENVMRIIKDRGGDCGLAADLKLTEISRGTKQILWMTRPRSAKEETPFETGVKLGATGGVVLDSHDNIDAVGRAVKGLGYDLSDEDLAKVFESFTGVAAKKTVGVKELEAIIASSALQVPPTYKLVDYVINCGSSISATAVIHCVKDGQDLQGMAAGDGPIDASFLAIEQITGHHFELDDFQIQSVTEGREAMGSTLIKLRSDGRLYSGNGISTDILGASIRSYLNALNKIAFEETRR